MIQHRRKMEMATPAHKVGGADGGVLLSAQGSSQIRTMHR